MYSTYIEYNVKTNNKYICIQYPPKILFSLI